MNNEEPLRQRYLRWFQLGIGLLVLLAIPAILHSHAAVESLFNRPADWVPDSLVKKKEINDFLDHFSVADLVMIGWEESKLDSPSLAQAAEMLRPLSEESYDAQTDDAPKRTAEIAEASGSRDSQGCGSPTPLEWVRTGTETLDGLTSSPATFRTYRGSTFARFVDWRGW